MQLVTGGFELKASGRESVARPPRFKSACRSTPRRGPYSAIKLVQAGTEAGTPKNVKVTGVTDRGIRFRFEKPEDVNGVRVDFYRVMVLCNSYAWINGATKGIGMNVDDQYEEDLDFRDAGFVAVSKGSNDFTRMIQI